MIGIILAAGLGTRLRPLTNNKPKCLISVIDKPILQYQIDAYIAAGISEIIIIAGYEQEAIKEHCKHIKNIKINIIVNIDYEHTNNMYSLYLAKALAYGQSFILNNADLVIDKQILSCLLNDASPSAVAIDSSVYNDESMKVSLSKTGAISDISKGILKNEAFGCSIDFYKFSADDGKILFDKITHIIENERDVKSWTEVAMQQLFKNDEIHCFPCDIRGYDWVEVDDYMDLALADKLFSHLKEKLNDIKSIILDLDGTLYLGNTFIEGVSETLKKLHANKKVLYFATNNSSKNKDYYFNKLSQLDVPINLDQIVLSTDGVINYCVENKIKEVHILGTKALQEEFEKNNINPFSTTPEYVIIGYDTELNYQKLITICQYINNGVDILLTHSDIFCPTEQGSIPDVGAIAKMIEITTGKKPLKVFGKPNPEAFAKLIKEGKIIVDKTLVIGDRLNTDIKLAKNLGCYSMIVLTGETTRELLEKSHIKPDFILNSINDIY